MDKCILAENSTTTPSSTAKWWPDIVHPSSICSWTSGANYASNPPCNNNPQNPNSSGEEDVSISTSFTTNASNNSGISMESSRRLVEKSSTNDPYGEAVSDNHHLWNQVLLGAGTTARDMQSISTRMFEPACDYLKKIDSGWEYSSPTNYFNQFQKSFNSYNNDHGLYQNKNPALNVEISPHFNQYNGQFPVIKNEHTAESDVDRDQGLFRKGLNSHEIDQYQMGINDMVVEDNNKFNYNGTMSDMDCNNGRGFLDLVAFGSCLNKPPCNSNMSYKPLMNSTMNLPADGRKPAVHNSYQPIRPRDNTVAKINGRGNGVANEGKRKKSQDQSGSLLKKTKLENSTVSSTKVQVPKAKLGDKITALQQIVSPFGKTDTASVLWEALGYIKCLQEQVQLLSNPYMKTNILKDTWGRLETKDREDTKIDLKSRGLCLVPVSCTPQVYHENNGSDYWTPTYRGCFYR